MELKMTGISKSFGPVKALSKVDFTLGKGEIHGLLGENGAGKTTLMNILSGGISHDEGQILINGEEIKDMTPRKSNSMGIRFIHQELSLCNDLTVCQNMFLGSEYTGKGFIKKSDEMARCREVLSTLHLDIDPGVYVSELETAQKQLVEIARALLFKSEIIIMDEPTTALNTEEISHLFKIMREQKEQGVSFIYISHKMPELFEICDKYTVLRDGCFIQTGFFKDIDTKQATELLIGKSFTDEIVKARYGNTVQDEVVISVDSLSGATFKDASFEVKKGEVVVITGLQGSGTDELATALFGATPTDAGTVRIKGKALKEDAVADSMRTGLGMTPRNRKERGIVPDLSIEKNNSLAYFTALHKKLFISSPEEAARFEKGREMMDIKVGSPKDPITSLSGGNQQKVILSKWLGINAEAYIMDNPTQGIDVGAKFAIYQLICQIASQGKAIVAFTNEYPEIVQIADRVIVMYKGRMVRTMTRDEMTEAKVMAYSTGTSL